MAKHIVSKTRLKLESIATMPSKFTADALNTDYGDELARPPLSDTKTPRVPNRVQIMQSTRTEDAAIVCGGTDNEGLDAEVWGDGKGEERRQRRALGAILRPAYTR